MFFSDWQIFPLLVMFLSAKPPSHYPYSLLCSLQFLCFSYSILMTCEILGYLLQKMKQVYLKDTETINQHITFNLIFKIYISFKNFPLCAPGTKEGICPHEVLGASKSEGPRLSSPTEGSHCLGAHDSHTLLYHPGPSTPKGHMVRTSVCTPFFWPPLA